MSENKSRFKMKKGDIEIEYDGDSEQVSSKFTEVFNWLKGTPTAPPTSKTEEPVSLPPSTTGVKTKDKRGGVRSSVVSPAIDGLVKEGFLDTFKTPDQVFAELKRQTVPVANVGVVAEGLKRRVPKVLDRIQDEQGKWTYRKKPAAG